jgi:hypothetical protein
MEESEINSFIKELEKELEGKTARYLFKDNLHHIFIEGGGLSFFIYIHQKFFEEMEPIEILNEFYKYHVIDTINKSTKPIWLYLSISGLQEVDGNFIRTKPT